MLKKCVFCCFCLLFLCMCSFSQTSRQVIQKEVRYVNFCDNQPSVITQDLSEIYHVKFIISPDFDTLSERPLGCALINTSRFTLPHLLKALNKMPKAEYVYNKKGAYVRISYKGSKPIDLLTFNPYVSPSLVLKRIADHYHVNLDCPPTIDSVPNALTVTGLIDMSQMSLDSLIEWMSGSKLFYRHDKLSNSLRIFLSDPSLEDVN